MMLRELFAYTLRAWKWSGTAVGENLAPAKSDSAAKMAAKRAIESFVSQNKFPVPWSAEFLSTLCPAHQQENNSMKSATGGRLRLPREAVTEDGIPRSGKNSSRKEPRRQKKASVRDLLNRIEGWSADRLREVEQEHRNAAMEQLQIADELAKRARQKELTDKWKRAGPPSSRKDRPS